MSKTLFTTYSGGETGGIGSILQLQQHLFAYTKINGYRFHFPGFVKLSHYQPYGITQNEFCDKLNNFFNLPNESDESPSFVDESFLVRSWGEINLEEKKKYISELSKNIRYGGKIHFKENCKNVVIHVRVDNEQDNGLVIPQIEIYKKNNFKDTYIQNVIKNLQKNVSENLNIILISQGDRENFSHFEDHYGVKLLLNSDIVESLYHLIFADILVTSNSSFSYSSHLFNQNKLVISRDNFFHSWYKTTILTDINGNFKNLDNEKICF